MRRHSADLVSLVFGLVFLVFAALWPLWRLDVLDADTLTWFPATALIAIGVLGLALSITKARAPSREVDAGNAQLHEDPATDAWASDEDFVDGTDETQAASERPS